MTEHKLVIVGSEGVGKSALSILFASNYFVEDFDPTIENSYRKQVTIDNETCVLDIFDTTSQYGYTMSERYMRSCQGFICVYAVTSRSTFDEMAGFRGQILRVKDEDTVPMLLAGNKCDLEEGRQVTTIEGENLATKFGCPFYETSAKSRINVEELFYECVREICKFRQNLNLKFVNKPTEKKGNCVLI